MEGCRYRQIRDYTVMQKGSSGQAVHFSELAPNMIVKIPVTKAGVEAIEEATYRGISINATVSFTLPQAIAVAEAVERGLNTTREGRKGYQHDGPGLYSYGGKAR